MKKLYAILLVSILVLTGCGDKTEEATIRIGSMPSLTSIPFIYADEEDIFDKYGLDVELTIFKSSAEEAAALKGGSLDVINNDLPLTGTILEDGFDGVVSARTTELFSVLSGPKSGYKTLESLKGKTIKVGLSQASFAEMLMEQFADKYEFTMEPVNIPALGDRFGAMMSGDVDLALLPEPFATLTKVKTGNVLFQNTEGPYLTNLTWNREFVEAHEVAFKNFHKALEEATNTVRELPFSTFKEDVVEYGIVDADTYDLIQGYEFEELTPVQKTDFDNSMAWLKEKNLITKDFNFDDIFVDWK